MESLVEVKLGDGQQLPFADGVFDGGYAQHVTMNIADRARFFAEAYRVLRPGAFFAITDIIPSGPSDLNETHKRPFASGPVMVIELNTSKSSVSSGGPLVVIWVLLC